MSRRVPLAVLAALALASFAPRTAGAQSVGRAFSEIDPVGVPIAIIPFDVVPGGHYEVQTDRLAGMPAVGRNSPDTMLAIRRGDTVDTTTLTASDGCDLPGNVADVARSCVRFVAPTNTTRLYAWVWAARTSSSGTARLRIQRMTSIFGSVLQLECGFGGTMNCFRTLRSSFSFGGMTRAPGPDASGLVRFETAPAANGAFWARHVILFTPSSGRLYTHRADGRTTTPGGPGSSRRGGGEFHDYAEWTGLGSSMYLDAGARVVAGAIDVGGPFRLIRNDRVEHRAVNGTVSRAGVDTDGDDLGADLERALSTCDSPSSPDTSSTPPALRCRARAECDRTPLTPLCRASLRDSDADGIPDAIELFGHRTAYMPVYGASPARHDVFVEVDRAVEAHDVDDCNAGTRPPADPPTEAALRSMVSVWRSVDLANRAGPPGIFAHYDAGRVPSTLDPDAPFGWWHGSRASCTQDYPNTIEVDRRPFFHHQTIWPGNHGGGGAERGVWPPLDSSTSGAATLLHELGHHGGLVHEGPATVGLGSVGNHTPTHLSRMNYAYQVVGDVETGQDVLDVTFSRGELAGFPLDPRALSELCPFGRDPEIQDLVRRTILTHHGVYTGRELFGDGDPDCVSIDWDLDGRLATGVVQGPFAEPRARHVFARNLSMGSAGGDMAVGARTLALALVRPDDLGNPRLRIQLEVDGLPCDGCPSFAGPDRFPPCGLDVAVDDARTFYATGAGGAPARPRAIATEALAFGAEERILVVWTEPDGRLHAGYVVAEGNRWTYLGLVPGATVGIDAPRPRAMPALARVSGTGDVMLAWRATDADHTVTTMRGRWSATGGSLQWDAPLASALPRAPTFSASPELFTLRGTYGEGVGLAVADDTGLSLYTQRPSASTWTDVWTVEPIALAAPQGRPSVVIDQTPAGDQVVVAVHYGAANGEQHRAGIARSRYGSWWIWMDGGFPRWLTPTRVAHPPLLVLDDRASSSSGTTVRGLIGQWRECDENADCGGAAPTCGTLGVGSFCRSTNGLYAQVDELFLPFPTGAAAMRSYDVDEREALRSGFCRALRNCRGCTPPDADWLDTRICTPEPTYGPTSVPFAGCR